MEESLGENPIHAWRKWAFWGMLVLILGWRFLYFGEAIDEPHSWRQYDTAQYIWSFHKEGIDLGHPSVGWMGGHKHLVLEFPLPEAISAVLYNVFGPKLFWARLVTLLFFAGSAVYFRWILRKITEPGLADLSTLLYCLLPLGFVYSRAVHIDSSALFFGHAMVFHLLAAVSSTKQWLQLGLASAMATLGFMVKAPYLFYLAFPVAFYLIQRKEWKTMLKMLAAALPPMIALVLWQMHTRKVNDSAPDWAFIPEYHKFVDMWGWYFSTLEIRFMGPLWEKLIQRGKYELLGGFIGYLPFLAGLAFVWKTPGVNFMRIWLLGVMVYLLIFFPLNIIHNYYQLPFLAPAAFFLASALEKLIKEMGKAARYAEIVVWFGLVLLFAFNCSRLINRSGLKGKEAESFQNYMVVDNALIGFGEIVQRRVPENSLIIASYGGLDCRAPHLLYEAKRYGWSIKTNDLKHELIMALKSQGANFLIVMANPGFNAPWMAEIGAKMEVFPLPEPLGKSVYLWELGK